MQMTCASFRLGLCRLNLCNLVCSSLSNSWLQTRGLQSKCPNLGFTDPKVNGFYELGWEKYIFLFPNFELKFSIASYDECR